MIESTEQGLLATILANPDDIAPRLIYADWLDENGKEERAALIRNPIALLWERYAYGKWRWYFSRQDHNGEWSWYPNAMRNPMPATAQANYPLFPTTWRRNLNTVIFRRGFVDELGVDRFHSNTFRLLETQPVRTVTTTAEAMLEVVSYFGVGTSLRTIRLTTVPSNAFVQSDGYLREIRFDGVQKVHFVPKMGSNLNVASGAAFVDFCLRRVIDHYLTPRGITVELPVPSS